MESVQSDERPLRLRSEAGYSLVEMTIATAVAIIVGLGIYAIFHSQRKVAESQKIYNDLQTSCGFAMDQIKRELLLAGYRSQTPANPVSVAEANTVSFDYWDERAGADAPFDDAHYDRHTLVHFTRETNGDLVRRFKRWHTGSNAYEPSSVPFANLDAPYKQLLAKGIQSLNIQYFLQNNAPWVSGTSPLSDIRSVIVSLECQATKANPIYADASRGVVSDKYQKIRLQSEVRLRNIGVDANPRDTEQPDIPANLRAWDPGLCSPTGTVCGAPGAACASLDLAWDANTESDLAGYILYYGLASNSYSNRVRIARGPGVAGTRVNYTLTGLQVTKACDATQATYFLRIEAFDKSGNQSDRSAEITGPRPPATVPVTNLRSETEAIAANDSDTALNPKAPPAPTGFAAGTPADNRIQLSWTASPVAGLVGYRLYRSQSAVFTPVGTVAGIGNCIADEKTLGKDATGFLDTGAFLNPAILRGCTAYYYKLAAIHCDTCLAIADTNFAALPAAPTDPPPTPTDLSPPPAPLLGAEATYLRIDLRLDNPLRTTTPDFRHTKIWFSTNACPTLDPATGNVTGTLVPANGGVFPADGTVSIVFDSVPGTPAQPLDSDTTYSFLAVAYDQCDANRKESACVSLKPLDLQCPDDPPGAPSPVSGITPTAGCADNLTLSWSNPATTDFKGVHVYRCPQQYHVNCAESDWTELTSGYIANPTFTDTKTQGLQEGKVYSYRIRATDCYYEENIGLTPWFDPLNNPNDNYTDAFIDNLYPGRIVREDIFPTPSVYPTSTSVQALCGSLAEVPPSFQHNTVNFRVRNTAAGPLTITTLSPSWQNPYAFLQNIVLGDDNTTPTTVVWTDAAAPLSHGSAGGELTLSHAEIYALDEKIPVTLTFKNADQSVSILDNMREETLYLDFVYGNDAIKPPVTCGDRITVYVPLGPYVYGTTQDQPSAGTMAWAVPGSEGNSAMNAVLAPGQQMVNVYTNVSDSDYAGIREVRLYYYVDTDKAFGAAPELAATARYDKDTTVDNLAPYQRINLVPVAGNQWRTPGGQGIPASDDANVWYFIVAVDNNDNFDREPEPGSGAFQYYQKPYDVCYNTPRAPTLTGSYTSTSVSLSWTAPLTNTDGTSWTDVGGYNIYRGTLNSGPVKLATIVGSATLTYTDTPPNMGTETYSYYVSAYDTCTPMPNESAASNWHTECQGAPACTVNLHAAHGSLWAGNPGDSFTVDLSVCTGQNGVAGEVVYSQACSGVDANPVRLIEDGDSGVFHIDAGYYPGSAIKTWLTLPGSATNLDLRVNQNDTITVRGYQNTAGGSWNSTCDTTLACSTSVSVVTDPCASPVSPSAPRNLKISINNKDCNDGLRGPVGLTWDTPTTGPVSEYRIYRCIGNGCTPAQIGTSTTTSYTDSDAGASLKANVFTYEVRAVNLTCPTNILESVGVSIVETCD